MIDVHVHVNWQGKTPDDIVAHFDRIGVEAAWTLPWEAVDGGLYGSYIKLSTEQVMVAYRKYPNRFIPFCGVDPRRERADERVREWVEKGCRGYGEHKVRLCIDNPNSVAIYRLCGELGIPVLFHMDVPLPSVRDWYNPDIDGLERVLKKCTETIFMGHGPGFWREISGDADCDPTAYPEGKVIPGGKLLRLLAEYPNLYADLSAGSGLNAISRDLEFTEGFMRDYYQKLLYGTDSFDSRLSDFLNTLGLKQEVYEDITHNNAVRIIAPAFA